jgi:SH3 domain-containing YSC84-like protein 1
MLFMRHPSSLFQKAAAAVLVSAFLLTSSVYAQRKKITDRLENAGSVIKEATRMPEQLPSDLISKANCIIVIPSSFKVAFIFGINYGRGVMTCRTGSDYKGPWGAPLMVATGGGNFGLQLGAQGTDFILVLTNSRAPDSLMSSKVKLDADAAGAAFTKGRHAEAGTDLFMRAHILAYSRSRGLFTGVSVAAASFRPDRYANLEIYGRDIATKDVLLSGNVTPPKYASSMLDLLNSRFRQNKSTNTAENLSPKTPGPKP